MSATSGSTRAPSSVALPPPSPPLAVLRRCGEGAFGRVFLCRRLDDADAPAADAAPAPAPPSHPRLCALKVMAKARLLGAQQAEQIVSEGAIMASLGDHPFIARVLRRWQDDGHLYLLTTFCSGGELYARLRECGAFDVATTRFYLAQVVCALEHIHSKGITFRDLKLENLLLGADGYLSLVDFGFATRLEPGEKSFAVCGTPEYLAPEMIFSKGHDRGVDWWALGVLLYEMLVGEPPFTAPDPLSIYKRVARGDVWLPSHLDGATRSLLRHLLTADTTRRFGCLKDGADDIKSHRFFSELDFDALLHKRLPAPWVPPPPPLLPAGGLSSGGAPAGAGAVAQPPVDRAAQAEVAELQGLLDVGRTRTQPIRVTGSFSDNDWRNW